MGMLWSVDNTRDSQVFVTDKIFPRDGCALDCSQSPCFSVGFSRLVGFDGAVAILREHDLGRLFKLPRGAGVGRKREK